MTSFASAGYGFTYLSTGSFEIDAGTLFGNATADELAEALERHHLNAEAVVAQARALLVDTGRNRVLIDPAGTWEDRHGLAAALERAGIEPASVDTVIISHGHADHFWGAVGADGRPQFEAARYWMQRREWQHWLSGDNPEPDHVANFLETLLPIEDRFTLIDGETEIVPGITGLPTPGHSPGHMAVRIGEQATYTGDVLISPVQVEHPDWVARFDLWPEQVVESRRELLRQLGDSGSLVLTCHFPGSGAGRVAAESGGWSWLPEN